MSFDKAKAYITANKIYDKNNQHGQFIQDLIVAGMEKQYEENQNTLNELKDKYIKLLEKENK